MNILIIEDHGPEAFLLASLCEAAMRNVEMAFSLAEAWAKLAGPKVYDIIFLDLTLPGSSARETVQLVPEIKKKSRVVIVTGNEDPVLQESATRLGADGFLYKHDPEYADRIMNQLRVLRVT